MSNYSKPPGSQPEQHLMMVTNSIIVWRFHDAPQFLRDFSDNGGDEDWLALVPKHFRDKDGEMGWIRWIESSGFDTCFEPQIIPLKEGLWVPAAEGDTIGSTVFIGAHA